MKLFLLFFSLLGLILGSEIIFYLLR
jgi:hypothetical protein